MISNQVEYGSHLIIAYDLYINVVDQNFPLLYL